MLVRPATSADAAGAVGVLRDSISQLCVADHRNDPATLDRWLRNKTLDVFLGWLADRDNHVVVAQLDGFICGVGAVRRSGELSLCYVAPGRERMGAGRALLRALEDQAKSWAVVEVHLISTATARGFYEHHGFRFAGESSSSRYGLLRDYRYTKNL